VLQTLESRIVGAVSRHIRERYGLEVNVAVEQPRQASFGEFALAVAFSLARQLKKSPKAIADELIAGLPAIEGVRALEAAGGGYINVRLNRSVFAAELLTAGGSDAPEGNAGKVIVEHTNINPNKAAHIGHLRNAILGDTFVRMLRAAGRRVEVQNYIDNTGVQVADVVVGFHFLEKKSAEDVQVLIRRERFDYYCWELYARTAQYYKDNPESLQWRRDTLHAIEADHGQLAELGRLIADAIVDCHLNTMLRLGIQYDVLPRESEILHLKFWAYAFDQLKQKGAIYLETAGKNAGCWVMPGSAFDENREDEDSKVIVRSNGTVTYVGKDIAYQMWKFGLLGKDFHYRLLRTYADGSPVFVSTSDEDRAVPVAFGGGREVYNVIDSRQSYLQDVVVAGLKALGYPEAAAHSIHFSYEMVALSPRTCVELGIELSEEDRSKAYVEMSGRKGLGVKADDLIDKLIESAGSEVDSRNADRSVEDRLSSARAIAIGALRYFLLKFTRNTVIAFDFQEALSFTGETGPYVQYAAVRASKILRNVGEWPPLADTLRPQVLDRVLEDEALWQYLLATARTEVANLAALSAGEPAHMARYSFQLAQQFSLFYDKYRVMEETDPEKKSFLIWLTLRFRAQFERALGILGIPIPEFM
jgi:arginyl-tRNA synthetase